MGRMDWIERMVPVNGKVNHAKDEIVFGGMVGSLCPMAVP
jgi:hypothetical protein